MWRLRTARSLETGFSRGGWLIVSAARLGLVGGNGLVVGVDIDIRSHNRVEIESHPMSKRIKMIQGSSVDETIAREVYELAREKNRVLVVLDSNHPHAHVTQELALYSLLVTTG